MTSSPELIASDTSSGTRLPTFLIIGIEKAGTTSIYNYLKLHPQVYMSPVKETNFFERYWEQETPEIQAWKKNGIITLADYTRLFDGVTDEVAIGEVSPNYLFHHQVSAERIAKELPQAKLMAVLRNPVERAHSDYLMHIRDAIGTQNRSLREQLQHRSNSSFTLLKGKYYEPLKHYLELFGSEQLKVFLYEDLCQDSTAFMQSMYAYIGVDPTFTPDTSVRAQTAQVPKNQALNKLMKTKNPLRTALSKVLGLVPAETRQRLRNQLINLNSQDKSSAVLSEEDRQALKAYYREDVLKLQDLLQRDLSVWL